MLTKKKWVVMVFIWGYVSKLTNLSGNTRVFTRTLPGMVIVFESIVKTCRKRVQLAAGVKDEMRNVHCLGVVQDNHLPVKNIGGPSM